jgi:hypothetical protein
MFLALIVGVNTVAHTNEYGVLVLPFDCLKP